ncbi:cupin domain-containing protein [Mesorhizobium sp. M0296]|uniref:cupin domain-containing protein n=1 Tax=Mesorhizobium sp. M0296 TaxID=2956931 RepID=UPI0033370E34
MGILESLKKATEQATGIARPRKQELAEFAKVNKPFEFRFKDDGLVPNHPFWPFVVYRGASVEQFDSAAVLEALFEANGWSSGWRDGIYHYVHYHSRKNEVLGVAHGTGKVRFGGNRGRTLSLKAGDMAVLPAGTGHQCLSESAGFLVVGAYPASGAYDECTTAQEHERALRTIPKLAVHGRTRSMGAKRRLCQCGKNEA